MRRETIILLIMLLLTPSFLLSVASPQTKNIGILYYMYGMHTCPHCRDMYHFLSTNFPNNYYFCDIASSAKCGEYFKKYLKETELPGYIPQIIVVKNTSYVLAIVIGEIENKTFFDELAKLQPSTRVPIYETNKLIRYLQLKNMTEHQRLLALLYLPRQVQNGKTKTTTSQNLTTIPNTVSIPRGMLHHSCSCKLLPNTTSTAHNTNKKSINSIVLVPLALSDSINPCTIAIYTILLATVAIISRKKALLVGILFILGVFIGYTALGLSISYGLSLISIPQQVLSFILIGFGLLLVFSSIRKKECEVCKKDNYKKMIRYKFIYCLLNRAETMPVFSLLLGLLLSVTLLPCSMGPYIVFLISIKEAGVTVLPYILLYNVVFGVPLYVILLSLTVGRRYIHIEKYRKWAYLIVGTVLVVIGIVYLI